MNEEKKHDIWHQDNAPPVQYMVHISCKSVPKLQDNFLHFHFRELREANHDALPVSKKKKTNVHKYMLASSEYN